MVFSNVILFFLAALKNPEEWASYIILHYRSVDSSISVTFHQADTIAGNVLYNVELLQWSLQHRSHWKIYAKNVLHHQNTTGLERTVRFYDMPPGVYKVRLQVRNYNNNYRLSINELVICDLQKI